MSDLMKPDFDPNEWEEIPLGQPDPTGAQLSSAPLPGAVAPNVAQPNPGVQPVPKNLKSTTGKMAYDRYRLLAGGMPKDHPYIKALDAKMAGDSGGSKPLSTLAKLQADRDTAVARFGPDAPRVKALERRIGLETKTIMTPEQAGKAGQQVVGGMAAKRYVKDLFPNGLAMGKDGTLQGELAGDMLATATYFGARGKGATQRLRLKEGVQALLRGETGATAPITEVEEIMSRYEIKPWDTDETAREKTWLFQKRFDVAQRLGGLLKAGKMAEYAKLFADTENLRSGNAAPPGGERIGVTGGGVQLEENTTGGIPVARKGPDGEWIIEGLE